MVLVHCPCVCLSVCVCVWGCACVCAFGCINAGMPDCPASDQYGTGPSWRSPAFFWSGTWLKVSMPECRYWREFPRCWCPAMYLFATTMHMLVLPPSLPISLCLRWPRISARPAPVKVPVPASPVDSTLSKLNFCWTDGGWLKTADASRPPARQ